MPPPHGAHPPLTPSPPVCSLAGRGLLRPCQEPRRRWPRIIALCGTADSASAAPALQLLPVRGRSCRRRKHNGCRPAGLPARGGCWRGKTRPPQVARGGGSSPGPQRSPRLCLEVLAPREGLSGPLWPPLPLTKASGSLWCSLSSFLWVSGLAENTTQVLRLQPRRGEKTAGATATLPTPGLDPGGGRQREAVHVEGTAAALGFREEPRGGHCSRLF